MTSPVEAMRAVGNDPVNRPQHYTAGRKYEPIDVFEDWFATDPLLWQVAKYISRAGRKGAALQDLRKAEYYLKRAIAREERRDDMRAAIDTLHAHLTAPPPKKKVEAWAVVWPDGHRTAFTYREDAEDCGRRSPVSVRVVRLVEADDANA